MSKNDLKIGGVPCAMVVRHGANGRYQAVFDRDKASLDDIEGVNWAAPRVEGKCVLPQGYGFRLEAVTYSPSTRRYTAELSVAEQYLGDVTGYQAMVRELEADNAQKRDAIRALEDRLAEADETVIQLYERIEAASSGQEAPEEESGEGAGE